MKIAIRIVLLTGLLLGTLAGPGALPSLAQDRQEGDRLEGVVQPMLWEIVGDQPSYLFGTIHITDSRCTTLHPEVQAAFDRCQTLFVETAPRDQFKQLNAITMFDRRVTDVLSEELIARIDRQLDEINPSLSHRTLPPFKVYAWGMILPSLEAQMKDPTAEILDMRLVSLAQEADMDVAGLEDPATQLQGMDALSLEEQLAFLEDTLSSMEEADETGEDLEAELAEYYLQGDVDALEEYFNEELESGELGEELIEKIISALLYERNERMAATIVETLTDAPDQSHFFAAGTAHFVGEKSVQHYLQEQGFEVRRVMVGEPVEADR